MKLRVKLPELGEGVRSAKVLEWVRHVGDHVAVGEPLLAVELDKIDTEIPSPVDGLLVEQAVSEGDDVEVGSVICVIAS